MIIDMVLATDMARHFEVLSEFQAKLASQEELELDWRNENIALQMFIKVAFFRIWRRASWVMAYSVFIIFCFLYLLLIVWSPDSVPSIHFTGYRPGVLRSATSSAPFLEQGSGAGVVFTGRRGGV